MEIEQTISSSAVQKATISYSPAVSSGHHSGERPRWSGHLIRADPCECPLSTCAVKRRRFPVGASPTR